MMDDPKYVQSATIPQVPHLASTLDVVRMSAPAVIPEAIIDWPPGRESSSSMRILNVKTTVLLQQLGHIGVLKRCDPSM